MAQFHEQLKKIMQEKGISQAELSKRTGIPKSAMSQYLSGAFKPKQKRTYLLAKALGVSEAWLIGMDGAERERSNIELVNSEFHITSHEKDVIIAYRKHPEMQDAVDTLLGIAAVEQKEKHA